MIQFAFDGDPANPYLPENYRENCVVYTGTHDNDTTAGWFRSLRDDEQAGILQYLGYTAEDAWWLILESAAARKRGETLPVPEACVVSCAEDKTEGGVNLRTVDKDEACGVPYTVDKEETCGAPRTVDKSAPVPDPAILATDALVCKALASPAWIAVIPLQDYLRLGSEARINVPGTVVDNWCWRLV